MICKHIILTCNIRHTHCGSCICAVMDRAAVVVVVVAAVVVVADDDDADVGLSILTGSDCQSCYPSPRDPLKASASLRQKREGRTWPRVVARFPAARVRGCREWSARYRSTCQRCVAACRRCRPNPCSGDISSRCLVARALRELSEN